MSEDEHEKTEEVSPQSPHLRNSPIIQRRPGDESVAGMEFQARGAPGHASCMWDGKEYSDGGSVCDKESHTKYKCWNGRWVDIGNC